jgi:hypothetical protein
MYFAQKKILLIGLWAEKAPQEDGIITTFFFPKMFQ